MKSVTSYVLSFDLVLVLLTTLENCISSFKCIWKNDWLDVIDWNDMLKCQEWMIMSIYNGLYGNEIEIISSTGCDHNLRFI